MNHTPTEKHPAQIAARKGKRPFARLAGAAALLFALHSPAQAETRVFVKPASLPVLNAHQMQDVIKNGLAWLQNAQVPNGHFHYEYAPYWDRYTLDDNMVRQTGAFYLFGEVLGRDKGNKYSYNLKGAMQKALDFYQRKTVDGEFNQQKFKCVLKTPDKCTLGGTSLVLAGTIQLVQKYPELKPKYDPLIEAYKNYHVAMKVPAKGFRVAYFPGKPQSDAELSFSNGEAYLALVRYNAYKPSAQVTTVLNDAFKYYNELYTRIPDNNFYLWGMSAIKDLIRDPRYKASHDQYYSFVKTYTDKRILPYKNKRRIVHNAGAYIEGVVSAYSVMESRLSPKEKQDYLEEINFWLSRTAQMQVQDNTVLRSTFSGQDDSYRVPLNPRLAIGGFLTGFNEPYQRIDFTQHAVSGYLQKLTDIDRQPL